ncbi:MAG: glycosyltransferase family 39 protein [Saprospiraceae bacterium]|nr:glycosyltransferase family 39 protein [Saprospiraceae bacterium]
MKFKEFLWIFLAALLIWGIGNELNLATAKTKAEQTGRKTTVYDYMIEHPDRTGYTPHIHYILQGDGYTLDPKEPEMDVRRSPGYPFFYAAHFLMFGEETSFLVLRYTQLLLFGLSCVWMGLLVYNFSNNRKWAKWAAIIYAISPTTSMHVYFAITEGIIPSLSILVLYLYSNYYKSQKKSLLYWMGLCLGAIFLIRPVMGVMLPAIFLAIVNYRKLFTLQHIKELFVAGLIYGAGFVTLVAPWVIRNYIHTNGEIIVAEKFYQEAPMNFGRSHLYFRTLCSAWQNTGTGVAELFSHKLRNDIIRKDTTAAYQRIENFIEAQPKDVYTIIDKQEFKQALYELHTCFQATLAYREAHPDAIRKDWLNLPCQFELKDKFKTMWTTYKGKRALNYYGIVPAKSLFKFIFQSSTQHILFLNPKDGQLGLLGFGGKLYCFAMNAGAFVSLLLFLLFAKNSRDLRIIFSFILIVSLLVFLYLLRHLENRYMVPLVPFASIALGYWAYLITDLFLKRLKSKPNS